MGTNGQGRFSSDPRLDDHAPVDRAVVFWSRWIFLQIAFELVTCFLLLVVLFEVNRLIQ